MAATHRRQRIAKRNERLHLAEEVCEAFAVYLYGDASTGVDIVIDSDGRCLLTRREALSVALGKLDAYLAAKEKDDG